MSTKRAVLIASLACVVAWTAIGRTAVPRDTRAYYTASQFDLSELPAYVPEQRVSGTIRIWGSGYIAAGETVQYWEAGFRRHHPDVRFSYMLGESLNAVPAVYTGAADIGSGPQISWNDLKAFNHTLGRDPIQVMIATGSYNVPGWNPAFVIVVNEANPLTRLTLAQLDGIFGGPRDGGWDGITWRPELGRGPRQDLRRWHQLGLKGAFGARPVHVYGVNLRYGVAETFGNRVLHGGDVWAPGIRTFTNKPDRSKPDGTYLAVEQVADAVAADPLGIGYTGIASVKPGTRIVAIGERSDGPFVSPSLISVQNRTYPLADASFMYLDRAPGKPVDPKVREFMRYILSRDGQVDIAKDGKFLPLTRQSVEKERLKLD